MKATMDKFGVITLKAETSVESFALCHWRDVAIVRQSDVLRNEQYHWRGTMIVIDTSENKQEVLL